MNVSVVASVAGLALPGVAPTPAPAPVAQLQPLGSAGQAPALPVTLEITAIRIINNEVLAGGTNNERNPMANKFKILSHPLLDDQSTTAWYLGDFKKNFREKVIIPPQVLTRRMGDNNEDAWRKDIVASVKVRYDSQVGAVDYRYVGKSTGA